MRSARRIDDIDSTECADILDSEIERLKGWRITDVEVFDTMISVLAFKYWHENCSCQVNSMIESDDVDYVRINWPLFCKSNIGNALRCKAKCDKYDIIAGAIGRISRYVTRRHFDEDNIDLITQLASLIESQTGKTSTDRFEELKRVYGRALTRKR